MGVVLYIAASVDGFIADVKGGVGFLESKSSYKGDYGYKKFLEGVDVIVMGYNTYRQVLGFGKWPYKGKRCIVFTRRHSGSVDSNVEFVSDLEGFMSFVEGCVWLVGGSQINRVFLSNGLIDELIVTFVPFVLGDGISLFGHVGSCDLELVGCRRFPSGFVQMHYKVIKI